MDNKPEPTCRQIAIGRDAIKNWVTIPVWEKNTLLVGGVDSGRRYAGERVVAELIKTPKNTRRLVILDLKGGELSHWQRCADVFAVGLEEVCDVLFEITEEMERRIALVRDNPADYLDGSVRPDVEGAIMVYLNDIDALTHHLEDAEAEELRRYACYALARMMIVGGHGLGVSVFIECGHPDCILPDVFLLSLFQNRLVAHVDTPYESALVLGKSVTLWHKIDASRLTDHWMVASIDGKSLSYVRAVGEPSDADIKAVALDPQYFAEPTRPACPDARSEAVNKQFLAEHEQNLRDGFIPVGAISVSASEEEQAEFDKAVVKKIREIERGGQGS